MSKYWEERHLNQSIEVFSTPETYVKELRTQYERAINNINTEIYNHLNKIEGMDLASAKKYLNNKDLKLFKTNLEEFRKMAKDKKFQKELDILSKRKRISHLQAMETEINNNIYSLMTDLESEMFDILGSGYVKSYKDELSNFNIPSDLGFKRFNKRGIEQTIKAPWAPDGSDFSDRIWSNGNKLVNTIRTELTQSIIRGDTLDQVTNRISQKMDSSFKNARRLVRTEVNAIHTKARLDCFDDLNVEEVEINAKLDSRTSDICMNMNGKVIKLVDAKAGVTVPPFHPNCRSVIIPYIDDDIQREMEESAKRLLSKKEFIKLQY